MRLRIESSAGQTPMLGIGTAALGVPYGAPGAQRPAPAPAEARRALLAALDRGVRLIDTAPTYGESETLVGLTVGDRDDCIVATKLSPPVAGWDALSAAQTKAHVRACAQASLRALRRERLDLLQIHNADRRLVRRAAICDALEQLREEGLVAAVGASVYGEDAALAVIESSTFDAVQIAFSALDRRPERRVLPAATAAGKAVIARSLLLRGVLTPSGRELDGAFAALGTAAAAVRRSLGVAWTELPGAAAAFAASRPGIACALLGPRDERELIALLDQVERFAGAARERRLPPLVLPDALLDPRCWPAAAAVGG